MAPAHANMRAKNAPACRLVGGQRKARHKNRKRAGDVLGERQVTEEVVRVRLEALFEESCRCGGLCPHLLRLFLVLARVGLSFKQAEQVFVFLLVSLVSIWFGSRESE